jgi:hypothetical protein
MRFALVAAAILATALTGTAAVASMSNPAVAKLEAPLDRASNDIVAAGVVWACEGDTCSSRLDRRAPVARDCAQLAREVGRVASFSVDGVELDAEGLATCNRRAR